MWHCDDGRWELRGELDADHGAMLNTALREAQDAVFQRDGVVVTKVEALVEIANRSLDTITDRPGVIATGSTSMSTSTTRCSTGSATASPPGCAT